MIDKIFITGPHSIDKMSLCKKLNSKDDDLSIAERFSNDDIYKDNSNGNYIYYMSTQDIDLTYKNNFMLFVDTNNYISTGITLDSFYNNDLFAMEMNEFNNISNVIFKSESTDIVVIWIDGSYNKSNEYMRKDSKESEFLEERLHNENIKYMYFYNESDEDIIDTILNYINGDKEVRKNILDDNS